MSAARLARSADQSDVAHFSMSPLVSPKNLQSANNVSAASRGQRTKAKRLLTEAGQALAYFRFLEAMNNERPLEVNLPQPYQIMGVIKQPLTGRDVSVVADVFGRSENDVCTARGT